MIADFFTLAKLLLMTMALIVLMQVKIFDRTIENHFMGWVHTSVVAGFFEHTAEGAVQFGGEAYRTSSRWISSHVSFAPHGREKSK